MIGRTKKGDPVQVKNLDDQKLELKSLVPGSAAVAHVHVDDLF